MSIAPTGDHMMRAIRGYVAGLGELSEQDLFTTRLIREGSEELSEAASSAVETDTTEVTDE